MKNTNTNIKNANIVNTKELLTIEFRYYDEPKNEHDGGYRTKTITIGIYDTIEEAVEQGNKAIAELAKHFQVRANDKFAVHGFLGNPDRLVTNCCYPTKKISYFAKIDRLDFDDVSNAVAECFNSVERYSKYAKEHENDD